jgi:hypothetical protein
MTYLMKVHRPNIAMRAGAAFGLLDPDKMLAECGQQVIDPLVENK